MLGRLRRRPGAGLKPGYRWRPGQPSLGVDLAEWCGDFLQGFALGINTERDLDQSADDHDAAADQVSDGEAGAACTVPDQHAIEDWPDGTEDLGNREEDRESFGPDLDREDLADGQVARARAGGREEENDDPDEGLPRRVQDPRVEKPGAEG